MNELTKSLLEDLLENSVTVAIYGGGFKPPTKGHFTVVEKTLEKYPEIDELKIFVGGGVRDGITQEESIKVWDIYKNYLSPKVTVEPSVAPVKSILGYAKDHPNEKIYWILGAREGDEDDLKDIESRTKSIEKYPNIEVKVITSSGGVSGTKTRKAILDNNKEQFLHMIPDIDHREQDQIWNILSPIVKEGFIDSVKSKFGNFIKAVKQENKETKQAVSLLIKAAKGDIELSDNDKEYIGNQLKDVLKLVGLTAIATLPGGFIAGALIKLFKAEFLVTPSSFVNEVFEETWNPQEAFLSLAVFMKDNGMNVTPLPKIKVISDDKENASHLLGKTAYYNPADKSITLYTFGRHPKDVLRSFAHEMIHHEQNLNGTLGNISTTNTNEDDHLEDIEKEAYQKGNIMFRNWEDSIKNV